MAAHTKDGALQLIRELARTFIDLGLAAVEGGASGAEVVNAFCSALKKECRARNEQPPPQTPPPGTKLDMAPLFAAIASASPKPRRGRPPGSPNRKYKNENT